MNPSSPTKFRRACELLAVTNTCEHIQKTIRYITRDSEVTMFFIDEPEGQSEESLRKYHQQLSLLVDMITEGTDRDAFYSRLGKYLDEYGSLRTDLARIQLANKLPASVFFKLHAATQTAPMKPARELVDEAADVIEKLDEQTGKKVVLVGGLYGAHEWEIASMLEEAGLQVAADLLCTSGRDITPRTSTEDMPVFDRLVLDYFNRLPCMPSLPNKRFYNHLENLFVNRDVKGMIYIRPANCDSYDTEEERLHWSIDAPMLTLGDEYDQLHNEKLMRTLRDFAANL
ncbi:MAG: 2-hydroxyacyl-CoA dehydratase family protein [Planctomycetota bacterium]|nr:2-hydroxyacyl-CoA dehydratase family protein [Planctomycetota bacterium]